MVAVDVAASGSSPLARGLLGDQQAAHAPRRIIPARAGFTRPMSSSMSPTGDHPRSRGVYSDFFPAMSVPCGSSPLARGLRPRPVGHGRGHSDHPRSRGVYQVDAGPVQSFRGSSPLARGLRGAPGVDFALEGIIPARAGFTPTTPWRAGSDRDHPRSRGVYASKVLNLFPDWGSSPLARGLHLLFIP